MKLIVNEIQKKFEKKQVLKGASFTFEKGKIYGLIGRNGAGKSTFFNCINSDLPLDGGKVEIERDGKISNLTPDDLGYIQSEPNVPDFLTAHEFLKFFIDINKDKIKDLRPIDEYLETMHIAEEDRDRLLKDYSLGMKNKMMMLVNFILNPDVLLLDEPLTSFDIVVQDEMKDLFKSMKSEHIIIFSTHILELALDLCDEVVILSDGTLREVEKSQLDNADYKDKIIQSLRGEEDENTN